MGVGCGVHSPRILGLHHLGDRRRKKHVQFRCSDRRPVRTLSVGGGDEGGGRLHSRAARGGLGEVSRLPQQQLPQQRWLSPTGSPWAPRTHTWLHVLLPQPQNSHCPHFRDEETEARRGERLAHGPPGSKGRSGRRKLARWFPQGNSDRN